MALILLELDPARVDANVSPTKTEVKFAQEGQAFDAVRHAVKSALLQQGMAPSAEQMLAVDRALREVHGAPPAWPQAPASQDASLKALFGGLRETPAEPMMATPSEAPDFSDPSRRAFETLLDGLRIIGQLDKTFILAENRTSLLIVDQHVAHERILYERIREMRSRAPIEKQGLLTPATVELDPRASALLVGQLDEVQDLGFDVEPFGAGTFLLRSAPAALRGKDPVRVLKDVIEELALGGASPAREAIWITCACKMAVKAGDPLSPAEMEKLITDLTYTENPYLCPHGRPITIEMPKDALMRRFKR